VLDEDAHGRYLANMTEPSMCGGDAAFLSNYSDHLFIQEDLQSTAVSDLKLLICDI